MLGKAAPNKLMTPLKGPFRVIEFNEARNHYRLQHLNVEKTFVVDPTKVSEFVFNPTVTDPKQVALMDNQEFLVEDILEARGNPHRRTSLKFLVRWRGYEETSWEPWKNLRHNIVLKEYLEKSQNSAFHKLAKGM